MFGDFITKLRLQKDKGVSTYELISNIIRVFEIEKYIEQKYHNPDDYTERLNSLNTLKAFVKTESPEKFLKYVTTTKKKAKSNCIKLMSIHASKGLEFKHVFLVGIEEKKFPHERSEVLDEARLFYVGVTRSKDNLTLGQISVNNLYLRQKANKVSTLIFGDVSGPFIEWA